MKIESGLSADQSDKTPHSIQNELLSELRSGAIFPRIAGMTSHPVMISKLDGGTVWVNEAFELQTGWSLKEILGLRADEFLHGPQTNAATVQRITEATVHARPIQCEILNYRRDQSPFWLSIDAQPIVNSEGVLLGYFSIHTDVTSRKTFEEESLRDHKLLKLMSDALTRFISSDDSFSTLEDTLAQLLSLTSSRFGLIWEFTGPVSEPNSLQTIARCFAASTVKEGTCVGHQLEPEFADSELLKLATEVLRTNAPVFLDGSVINSDSGILRHRTDHIVAIPLSSRCKPEGTIVLGGAPVAYTNELIRFLEPATICVGQMIAARQREFTRKQMECSLREAEEMLFQTGQIASIGAWQLDLEQKILRWSHETRRIHEVGDDFLPQVETAINFYREDTRPIISEAVRLGIELGKPWDLELPLITAKGNLRWVRAIGKVEQHGDKARRLYGSFQDITERREAEDQRQRLQSQFIQSQKLESVGRLAGGIAHDFNNMLAVILGHTEMMLMDQNLSTAQKTHLKAIQTASHRSAEMTHQLLAFARRQSAAPQKLNLNKTVRQVLELLRKSVGENIRIDWIPSDDLWTISIDPVQVDQLLAHLCVNAREAMPGGGRILISTRNARLQNFSCQNASRTLNGDFVILTLSDNGPGISHEVISRLYEPFTTTKPVGQGPGLGLSTVYGIVQQNNGDIEIESDASSGTSIRIYLPRVIPAPEPNGIESGSIVPFEQQLNILLIEDEPALKKLGKLFLQQLGHHVTTAESAEEALKLLASSRRRFSLVITDLILAGISGEDLAHRALKLQSGLRFVIMTGHSKPERNVSGALQNIPWLTKPFELQQLADAVRLAMS